MPIWAYKRPKIGPYSAPEIISRGSPGKKGLASCNAKKEIKAIMPFNPKELSFSLKYILYSISLRCKRNGAKYTLIITVNANSDII